jgi:hypothetical protein
MEIHHGWPLPLLGYNSRILTAISDLRLTSKSTVVTTDGQFASLSCCHVPIWGPRPDFYCCHLWVCWYGRPTDERKGLSFTVAAGLASAISIDPESHVSREHLLLSQIWDSPNLEGQVSVCITPGTGWPSYTHSHWVPFLPPLTTHRATVDVSKPAST